MGFWESKSIKSTRKSHRCGYCGQIIPLGSSCKNEVGTYEGDFNHYYLCNRCVVFMDIYRDKSEDELGEFAEEAYNSDLLDCPKCKSNNRRCHQWGQGMQNIRLECDICSHEWTVDLSLEALQTIKACKEVPNN